MKGHGRPETIVQPVLTIQDLTMRVGQRGGKVREGRGRFLFAGEQAALGIWRRGLRLADDLTLRSRLRFFFFRSTRNIYICIYACANDGRRG